MLGDVRDEDADRLTSELSGGPDLGHDFLVLGWLYVGVFVSGVLVVGVVWCLLIRRVVVCLDCLGLGRLFRDLCRLVYRDA